MRRLFLFIALIFTTMANAQQKININVNGCTLTATLTENDATSALLELLQKGEMTIEMEDYGGFEKVGALPQSLPRNDRQITTTVGDIMLYSGNNIVIFYGSNSWAYTPLGKIDGMSASELKTALGNGSVNATFSLPNETGISAVSSATSAKGQAFRLDGTLAQSSAKGIVIQNGKKTLK